MLRSLTTFAPLLASLILVACVEDPLFPEKSVLVTAVNLPALTAGGYYELWLSYPSEFASVDSTGQTRVEYFSIGRFRVNASGAIAAVNGGTAEFRIPPGYNPDLVGSALLTVEQEPATDTLPTAVLLAGYYDVDLGTANLALTNSRAFGRLFEAADSTSTTRRQGSFILETPTSLSDADWMRGIWFAIRATSPRDTVKAGLVLPAQPSNAANPDWRYGAWLVNVSDPLNRILLGRFDSPNNPDHDQAGPHAGTEAPFPFPGQDFVTQPTITDLRGAWRVIISLEPRSFALPAPLLPVLVADSIPLGLPRGLSVGMRVPNDLPAVEVRLPM